MPTLEKAQSFVGELGKKGHNLDTDTLKVALTNTQPLVTQAEFDSAVAHVPPASANGYTAGGEDVLNSFSEVGGTATLEATGITFTADGGQLGPFRYMVLYNDTSPTKKMIGFYDHGQSVTLNDGEQFVFDVQTNLFTLV